MTHKNAPVLYWGNIYSPLHRVMLEDRWVTARQLLRAGLADAAPCGDRQWYGHVLLDGHHVIETTNGKAESLLPTERALSGMASAHASAIRQAAAGHTCALSDPDVTAAELRLTPA